MAESSNLGVFEQAVLGMGICAIILGFIMPFIDKINESINNLRLLFSNHYFILITNLIIMFILIFYLYRKFLKKSYEKKFEKFKQEEATQRKLRKKRRMEQREEEIDNARREKDYEKEIKLLTEKYLEEGNVKELVRLEGFEYIEDDLDEEDYDLEDNYKRETKEQIDVRANLNNPYHKAKNLNLNEIEFLIKQGYKKKDYKSPITNKKEDYLIKPRFNESLNHLIIIYDLAEYLKIKNIDYKLFITKMPDIVMELNNKKVAIEVETGTVMSNMKKFKEKVESLNENYNENWYFIVTNRNKIKRYRKFGKVIDPRYLKKQIDKIIEKHQK